MVSCEKLHIETENSPQSNEPYAWRTDLYLRLDPEEKCYEGSHLYHIALIAIPSFLVYAIGLPVAATVILWRNREFNSGKKYRFRMGLLYSGYRKSRWYWECFVVLRKLSIIFLASFFYNEKLQLQLTLGVLFAAFILHHVYVPFDIHRGGGDVESKNERLDVLERNSILVSAFLIWSASVFYASDTCENGFCYFLVISTFLLNVAFMISGIWYYALYFLQQHHKIVDRVTTKLRSLSLHTMKTNPPEKKDERCEDLDGEGKIRWKTNALVFGAAVEEEESVDVESPFQT